MRETLTQKIPCVTFTAYDPEKPHLNATSTPIDLGPPPEAVITSITPEDPKEGDDIRFEGEADHALGETDYRWKIDGEVYEQKEFNTSLPAGEYEITFEVRDNREEWYGTTRTMNVEEEDEDVLRSFFYSIEFQIALIIILIGVTLNFAGKHVLAEKT